MVKKNSSSTSFEKSKQALENHEMNMGEIIRLKLPAINERIEKTYAEMPELIKSLEYTRAQLNGEIGTVKKDKTRK